MRGDSPYRSRRVFICTDSCEFVVEHRTQNKNRTDDPRNGLTLCRAHHWAFDAGLFTLTPEYTIVVSPLVRQADSRKFEMLSLDGQRMQIPKREVIAPHPQAIEWHQEHIYRA